MRQRRLYQPITSEPSPYPDPDHDVPPRSPERFTPEQLAELERAQQEEANYRAMQAESLRVADAQEAARRE